ncbi:MULTISPECIES: hypothetical protein [Exiguobacterium]|uniref:hypothetical protein n=1 Tax=Exiguobacterium TaxID=33986 RepID=UPI001BE56913|nr:hypothetical protein [Exiguobacterium sp. s83]
MSSSKASTTEEKLDTYFESMYQGKGKVNAEPARHQSRDHPPRPAVQHPFRSSDREGWIVSTC